MDTEKQKELMITLIKQFETNKAMGYPVDRTKRALIRRFDDETTARVAYAELLEEGEIHEIGDGSRGNPITVVIGPKEFSKLVVPHPWSLISVLDLADFMTRLADTYDQKGWSRETLDFSREFQNALREYNPGRPY